MKLVELLINLNKQLDSIKDADEGRQRQFDWEVKKREGGRHIISLKITQRHEPGC